MKVRYTRTALLQIDQALAFYAARSQSAATALSERIRSAVELIADYPLAAQATSRAGIRRIVMTPYPYALFYRVAEKEIVVLRFRHAARRPPESSDDPNA